MNTTHNPPSAPAAQQPRRTLKELTRRNIWNLTPYSSARDEYKGIAASVFLDANENPYNPPYNRYPDPLQHELKRELSGIKRVSPEQIFLGNGSDEAIDLLYRAFCEPGKDNVAAIDPTYGMYRVCADINDVEYRAVSLGEDFHFSAGALLAATDENTKLVFVCSPNNPTANSLPREEIEQLITRFDGIVVLDEAYADFSASPSWLARLNEYPNLVILQTFSKAWGCAGIRLGTAYASEQVIAILNKIKYPYNVNLLTQREALRMLRQRGRVGQWIETLKKERDTLMNRFGELPCVEKVFPSDANFFLARVADAVKIYNYLVANGIIVRNRHTVSLCGNCLRITVGTNEENALLITTLEKYT